MDYDEALELLAAVYPAGTLDTDPEWVAVMTDLIMRDPDFEAELRADAVVVARQRAEAAERWRRQAAMPALSVPLTKIAERVHDAMRAARHWQGRMAPAKLRAHPHIESDLLRFGGTYRAVLPVEFGSIRPPYDSTLRVFGLLVIPDFFLPTDVLRILADDDTLLWDSRMVPR